MEKKISENQASSKVEINIPDISNVEIKTHKSNDKLPGFIKLLCSAQIFLIVVILFIVCCSCIQCSSSNLENSLGFKFVPSKSDTYAAIFLALITLCATLSTLIPYIIGRAVTSKQIHKEAKLLVDEVFQMTKGKINNLIDQIADIQITQSLLKSQIEGVKTQVNAYQGQVNAYQGQVNAYQGQVEETKNDLEDKIKKNYDATIKQLLWEEGHMARMIAYLLRYKQSSSLNDDAKTKDCEENENKNIKTKEQREVEEICWSIGWSAKAMIRYFMSSGQGFHIQDFLNICTEILTDCKDAIESINKDIIKKDIINNDKGRNKVVRAFIDLYDTFRFYDKYEKKPKEDNDPPLVYTQKEDVKEFLKTIYDILVADCESEIKEIRINEIKKAIKNKAKWKEYLPNIDKNARGEEEKAQKVKALEDAHRWLIKNGICDENWKPLKEKS